LERYTRNGNLLILGCGTASVAGVMDPKTYHSIQGIDLSPEAISIAEKWSGERVSFKVADMMEFEPERPCTVILFSESIYYINKDCRVPLLKRLAAHLDPEGSIIVTVAQPQRYAEVLQEIRNQFHIKEDRFFKGSGSRLLIFN